MSAKADPNPAPRLAGASLEFAGDTMRERINRLAKGIVDGDSLKLSVMPEIIEDTVQAGTRSRKELYIADTEGRFIKGLVYSSNARVFIPDNSFGGSRNHITYEVDSRHLTRGDVIEGAFCLVTNGGEKKVSYSFSIDVGAAGQVLGNLKTPADFAALVRKDYDLALQLFEYRDFVEAPFMQDLHIRSLYEGLKGRLNRQNQLEEFLVALHVKEPVELRADQKARRYENLIQVCQDVLAVRADSSGYVQFEVSADGDFLSFEKHGYTSRDFKDKVCSVVYQINPEQLHQGRNLGAIRLKSIRSSVTIPIEVMVGEDSRGTSGQQGQDALMQYLTLRLKYEFGLYEKQLLLNQMKQPLERLRRIQGDTLENLLRLAEVYLLEGQTARVLSVLESARQELEEKKERGVPRELACFYQYLRAHANQEQGQLESLLHRVKQYLEQEPYNAELYLLKLKMDPDIEENPAGRLEELRDLFWAGCHSPYLYACAFRIYETHPQLIGKMGDYEVQVMSFAARHGLVSEGMALVIAEPAASSKHYRKLYCRLLMKLYGSYPQKELLAAVCSMLIKGECRTPDYFTWYQKALEEGVSLTRLYEYYLYSLPFDYPYLLPKEVLLYFSYEKSMDDFSRSILYMNILKYMNQDTALYRQYERDIERFTMDQLLKSRINRRMVVLYQHMLYKEMIDEKAARVLPSILRSYRIRVQNANIRYVVVCYEEMDREDVFPVKEGVAYVPLYSEHPVLLFEDEYGSRYANISYRKMPAMEKENIQELEEQCYEIYPAHPMLRLQECGQLAEAGISGEEDLQMLKRAVLELEFSPLFRQKIVSRLVEYYCRRLETDEESAGHDIDYLMGMDMDQLTQAERAEICEILIQHEYIREAYDIMTEYGFQEVRSKRLLKLCTRMILQQLFDEDAALLQMSYRLFSEDRCDSVVLDYLCEHFNGSTKQMFEVLSQGIREHVEVYDMPERLLAQMMFTGETDRMDQVFDWYVAGRKTSDHVVKAYFTLKSAAYFLHDEKTEDKVFAYLESVVQGAGAKHRIPTIYLVALSRYYSTLKELDEERKSLCSLMVGQLMEEGRVFSWFRDLGRLVPMPESVMDKVTVEYRGGKDRAPELEMRIRPEEEDWTREEMRKVYPGIYVRQKVLFAGETLEYRIWEQENGDRVLADEGSLVCEEHQLKEESSRFAALNEMSLAMASKDEASLKDKMKKYVTDSAMMEELFGLL